MKVLYAFLYIYYIPHYMIFVKFRPNELVKLTQVLCRERSIP